jgi:HEAT repeat protein
MSRGSLRQSTVNDVLRYDGIDVSSLEQFLDSEDDSIRLNAVRIIGTRGDISKLIEVALREDNLNILGEALTHVAKRKDLVEQLLDLVTSENITVREQAIVMFRAAGRADCLMPLLFEADDRLVLRIKKYMEMEDDAETSR